MTAGYSAAGACWATPEEAIDAHYSAQSVSVSSHYNSLVTQSIFQIVQPYKSGASWYFKRTVCSDSACYANTTVAAQSAVYGTCTMPADSGSSTADPLTSFTDGHLLGWGVAAAMVAAWAVHVLRRAI